MGNQKNILILGLGAFGFAIANHLGKNNLEQSFYATEVSSEIFLHIKKTREHPYFFPGVKLPENIQLIQNTELNTLLPHIDIIISVIPCQFTAAAFADMKPYLKEYITILNLSKGINNQTLETMSEKLTSLLNPLSYTYAYLAGGMIAQELIDGNILGADIVTENQGIGLFLKEIFESKTLHISLKVGNPKNTELYAALKNIIALILGYYEGQGVGASTLGYYFTKLLGEIEGIISLLGGAQMTFTDYALSGDLIATCFGNSRNRLLGNMLGKGMNIEEALAELTTQKKIAEGYETLKAVKKLIAEKEGFEEIGKFCRTVLHNSENIPGY